MKSLFIGFILSFALSAQASLDQSVSSITEQIQQRYLHLSECTEHLTSLLQDNQIEQAQRQWLKCRSLWESGEAHTFGPATLEGYDEMMDSWPLDVSAIDQLMSQGQLNTLEDITLLDPSLRGFHAIEYLIFVHPQQSTIAALFAEDLNKNAQGLYKDWIQFEASFLERHPEALYPRTEDAIQEILNGGIESLTEVAEAKLLEPIQKMDERWIESPYAKQAMVDFLANIQGPYDLLKPILKHSQYEQEISQSFEGILQKMHSLGSYEEAFKDVTKHQLIKEISEDILSLVSKIESDLKSEWL